MFIMTSVVVIRQTSAGIIQGVAVSCTLFMAHTTLKPRNNILTIRKELFFDFVSILFQTWAKSTF